MTGAQHAGHLRWSILYDFFAPFFPFFDLGRGLLNPPPFDFFFGAMTLSFAMR
jgi:hypothetical protein